MIIVSLSKNHKIMQHALDDMIEILNDTWINMKQSYDKWYDEIMID